MNQLEIRVLFHCYGKISTIIDKGFINNISPTIYETFSPYPTGDVWNLKGMRYSTDKKIITHGNIDLTFLRDSSMEVVKEQALNIIEQTEGYPHIIGPSDPCVWPGTPPENLKVICDLMNDKRMRF